jgi:hypothetical protein
MWIAIAIFSIAASSAAADTLVIDTNAYVAFFGPMAGGSILYEHRFTSASGITLRALGDTGEFSDGGGFEQFTAQVGYRHHWGAWSLGVEAGWMGLRHERRLDDFDQGFSPVTWYQLPAAQLTFGGRIGPVEVGAFMQIPAAGLGVHVGLAID